MNFVKAIANVWISEKAFGQVSKCMVDGNKRKE
jgi:hypothetical protein